MKDLISKTKSNNKETIYPIGFLQSLKKSLLFGRTIEEPEKIFTIQNKKKTPTTFSRQKDLITIKSKLLGKSLHLDEIENLVSSHVKGKDIITFLYGKDGKKKLMLASSRKDNIWSIEQTVSNIKERGGIVPDYIYKNKYHILYYGDSSIYIAASSHFKNWVKLKEPILKARPGFFDKGDLKFVASKITDKGIIVFYDASIKEGEYMNLQIGAALFSLSDPKKIIWRSDIPIFEQKVIYEKDLHCAGTLFFDETVSFYWYGIKQGIFTVSLTLPFHKTLGHKVFKKLKRSESNPLVSPKRGSGWQSEGTFNPAALEIDDTTHLLFRAVGNDGVSRVGYASSKDGSCIDEIHERPVFSLETKNSKSKNKKYNPVMYPSGGSWGGCEDPRVVKIDDLVYMTFNAFDDWSNIRVGLTSIPVCDFLNKKWNWSEPKLISPKGERHKNWVLFPEKINGKFVVLHNINSEHPNEVCLEYFDDLDSFHKEENFIKSSDPQKLPNKQIAWHLRMRSAGPPPIKTEAGWLVLYHATDSDPSSYKMGAMLLDLKNPTKVISRSILPILTPDMWYENDWKPGIVYACGAVIKNDTLFIYYGGGDKHICVATTSLKEFLESLKENKGIVPLIKKVIIS